MAFDGIMTAAVTYELNHTLQGRKNRKRYTSQKLRNWYLTYIQNQAS